MLQKHEHGHPSRHLQKSKNAWMNTTIFQSWFHDVFVPDVQRTLQDMELEPKALLLLDNCSAHPDEEFLVSADGLVTAKFLLPNVTALIQPMDQGVLESLKRRYRKSLLRDIILSDEQPDLVKFIKGVNMKVVAEKVALAWDELTPTTIRRSWRKLLPIEESQSTEETSSDNAPLNSDFEEDSRSLGLDLSETDVAEWLTSDDQDPGYEHLDDNAIVDLVLNSNQEQTTEVDFDDGSEIDEATPCPVTHKDAMEMSDKMSYMATVPT